MKITLKNLSEATAQQVFDQIAEHLLSQMKQSISINYCAYRGLNGLKCAVGCLITDDEYMPEMETYIWYELIEKFNISSNHMSLIVKLQKIHDHRMPENWKEELKKLSKDFNLEWKF